MGQQPETSATVLIQHNKDISLNEGPKMVKIQAIFSAVSKSQASYIYEHCFCSNHNSNWHMQKMLVVW